MWSDNESTLDLLGFETHVNVVTEVIKTNALLPVTIGVYGDWGSGKSSLMRMLAQRLSTEEDILVLSFNGWQFEGYDDAKAALMGTIIDTLKRDRRVTEKAADLAKSLAKRVDWFRLMGLAAKKVLTLSLGVASGVPLGLASTVSSLTDLSKVKEIAEGVDLEKVKEFLRDSEEEAHTSIREFREDFGELIAKTNYKAVVILVDDLDRCLPPTIIETLEAIRLFMFVPNTAFIIGADERIIRHAVTSKFPAAPDLQFDVGRDYLEKVIQFPIRIPSLGSDEIETYMNLLFAQLHLESETVKGLLEAVNQRRASGVLTTTCDYAFVRDSLNAIPIALEDDLTLSSVLAPVLCVGLQGNPRQIKRFLNSLLLRIQMAKTRKMTLQKQVMAKLMLLEYFQLVRFRQLSEWQKENDGCPPQIKVLEEIAASGKSEGVPAELEAWVTDSWVRDWLLLEPSLVGVTLGPYFHFSRERITDSGTSLRRLGPKAKEVLAKLLQEAQSVRKVGAKESGDLSQADAVSVFNEIGERAKRAEDNNRLVDSLFELVEVRRELVSQLVTMLGELPARNLAPSLPHRLALLVKGSPSETSARRLYEAWAGSGAPVNVGAARLLKPRR